MRQEQFIAARRGLPGEVASRRGRAVPGLLVGVLLVAGLIGGGSLAWLSASGTLALGTVSAGDLRVSVGAIARWQATVAFPPSLNPIGVYVNQADVRGTAEDGSTSWARALFRASLYPDPTQEPDVTLVLVPVVTAVNPAVTDPP